MIANLVCFFKRHKRGKTVLEYLDKPILYLKYRYHLTCKRCGYKTNYESPLARLIGEEIKQGFTGE